MAEQGQAFSYCNWDVAQSLPKRYDHNPLCFHLLWSPRNLYQADSFSLLLQEAASPLTSLFPFT